MVFQLVSPRYEQGSIVVTSNTAFSEWGQVLGDDGLAAAFLVRLVRHCDVVSSDGPSYRLNDHVTPKAGGTS